VILVDSNIFMYASGGEHPHRTPSLVFLDRIAERELGAAIDAEVLQEILYRYISLGRWAEGRSVFDNARILFPEVLPVTAEVMDVGRRLVDEYPGFGARDAVHAAVVEVYGLTGICSFDQHFDRIHGLRRVEP
jgi:predicted nucleic acid-binding protein